jgi:hypothetical protein
MIILKSGIDKIIENDYICIYIVKYKIVKFVKVGIAFLLNNTGYELKSLFSFFPYKGSSAQDSSILLV